MEVIYILVPATLLLATLFVGLFIFSVNKGQFDEVESPANRMLFEENESITNNIQRKEENGSEN